MTAQAKHSGADYLFTRSELSTLNALSRRLRQQGIRNRTARHTPSEEPGADTFMIFQCQPHNFAYSIEKHRGGNYVLQDGEGNVICDQAPSLGVLVKKVFPPTK
jgi:hypothetical protein